MRKPPTLNQINKFVENPCWDQINQVLLEKYSAIYKIQESRNDITPHWRVTYFKKDQELCCLYPMRWALLIKIIIKKHQLGIAEKLISPYNYQMKLVFQYTDLVKNEKRLMFYIQDENYLTDLLSLLHLRYQCMD